MRINKKYLPSKKFVTAVSIAAVLVLIAVALGSIKFSGTKNTNLSTINASSSPSEIDSDNDGLPDWEEALYNTDPHNIDTDGDGTPDGEEINEGRDPLKANTAAYGQTPNDTKYQQLLLLKIKTISSVDQNMSATEKMAQDLMSNIFASQPTDGAMDQDTQNTLVEQSLADIPQKQFAGTTTVSNLNLVGMSSSTAGTQLAAYANSFYSVTNPLQKLLGQDIALVKNALANGTAIDQKSSGAIAAQYQNTVKNLIQMPLPGIPGIGSGDEPSCHCERSGSARGHRQ